MSVYNSAEETAFTKDDFEQLQKCVVLAVGIGAQVGLNLGFRRNIRDWEYLGELHTYLSESKDKLSTA